MSFHNPTIPQFQSPEHATCMQDLVMIWPQKWTGSKKRSALILVLLCSYRCPPSPVYLYISALPRQQPSA